MKPRRVWSLDTAEARLRAHVQQVWHRPNADSVVAVTLGRPPPGHVVAEEYAVLPHPAAPRFLVPLVTRAAATASFQRYRAIRAPLSRAVRAALGTGYALGLAEHAFRHRLVVSVDRRLPAARWSEVLVLPHLSEQLDRPELSAFSAIRRINPNAKPTLELFDRAGCPVGYAKLGTNQATRGTVRNEAAAIAALQTRLKTVIVPGLLAAGDWGETAYTVGAPLPPDVQRWTHGPEATVEAIVEVARSGGTSRGRLAGSPYATRLRDDIAAARAHDDEVPGVLGSWLDRLEVVPMIIEFGRMHGDWIPDNLARSGHRLAAWDWEHSAADAPVGFDLLHWHFHHSLAADGVHAGVAEVDQVTPLLGLVGVAEPDQPLVASLYLLDLFVRRMKLALGGGGWNARWYPALLEVAGARDRHLMTP